MIRAKTVRIITFGFHSGYLTDVDFYDDGGKNSVIFGSFSRLRFRRQKFVVNSSILLPFS